MAGNELIPFGAAVAADVLSAFHLPGGNTLQATATAFVEKRRREAATILIEEVSRGWHGQISFAEHDVDPLIEIILRFSKAVAEGAARENLRLLAQVIAGLKKNKALQPDKFRKWCGVLEQLTRDELIVIGTAYRLAKKNPSPSPESPNTFWQDLQSELAKGRYESAEIIALCASLSRTGLLVPVSAWGSTAYMSSPWLIQLGVLADLEGVPR